MIFGSLILFSDRNQTDLPMPLLEGMVTTRGQHVVDKHKGQWMEVTDLAPHEIFLPQRYKRMWVSSTAGLSQLADGLEVLDSEFGDARQLYKLGRLMTTISEPFTAVVNNVSTNGESGSFYLLSTETLYVNLVFDIEEHSVRIVWSDFDLKSYTQAAKQFRYVFYAMPTLTNRPLFIHSQTVCSRWWKFKKAFGESRHGLLRSCNALELFLYKDPDIPNL